MAHAPSWSPRASPGRPAARGSGSAARRASSSPSPLTSKYASSAEIALVEFEQRPQLAIDGRSRRSATAARVLWSLPRVGHREDALFHEVSHRVGGQPSGARRSAPGSSGSEGQHGGVHLVEVPDRGVEALWRTGGQGSGVKCSAAFSRHGILKARSTEPAGTDSPAARPERRARHGPRGSPARQSCRGTPTAPLAAAAVFPKVRDTAS